MNRYIVNIEETVNEDFEVYAESPQEAFEIAAEKYENGEFVLEPGNLTDKKIAVFGENNEQFIDWEEF